MCGRADLGYENFNLVNNGVNMAAMARAKRRAMMISMLRCISITNTYNSCLFSVLVLTKIIGTGNERQEQNEISEYAGHALHAFTNVKISF